MTGIANSPLARWKKLLFTGIFVVLALLVAEFLSGLALRHSHGYDGEHLYQYEFDPYKNLLPTRNYVDVRGVEHNSQGFRRSRDVPRTKPPGTYRVFLLGASTAYGLGGLWKHLESDYPVLKNSETIDAYLQRYLDQAFPALDVEVINAAITSTWTHHHLIYLNQTILGFDPDMVLFLDGYNDFYHFNRGHDQFASYSYNLPSRVIMGHPTLYSLAYGNGWWLFRKSALAHLLFRFGRTVKRLVEGRPKPSPVDVDRAMEGLRRVFPNNALKMQRRSGLILRDEGVIPVFMLQPMLILERDRSTMTPVERELFEFNLTVVRPNWEEFMQRAVDFVREREAALAADLGAEFLDLTGVFRDAEGQMYTDYAHLTPRGNSVLARYVADRLIPVIEKDITAGAAIVEGTEAPEDRAWRTGPTAGSDRRADRRVSGRESAPDAK